MKAVLKTSSIALTILLASCGDGGQSGNSGATANAGAIQPIPAPNGGDWTQIVSQTPEGGFRMGNPDAPVKLIEYASLTCSHCADFSEQATEPLTNRYVKSGQVSYELRNFVRDPADIAGALLTRCGGPTPYFKLTDQMFAAQEEWFGKLQSLPQAEQQRIFGLPPAQSVPAIAAAAGLDQFVRARGIPAQKAQACLTDQAELQKLVDMNSAATSQYQIAGTPTFLINGKVAEGAADWATLEPQIQAAIGG